MVKDICGQLNIFDFLQNEITSNGNVTLSEACEFKNGSLHEYTVNTTYADVVLLISMLHEYIEMLKDIDGSRVEFYRRRFETITDYLEKGIGYDYREKLEKCRKKNEKDDRLDENWIGA